MRRHTVRWGNGDSSGQITSSSRFPSGDGRLRSQACTYLLPIYLHFLTNATSSSTIAKIKAANVALLASETELVSQADIILSIVLPRDAVAIAQRIADACNSPAGITARKARRDTTAAPLELTYVDLNAISPKNVHLISGLLCPEPPKTPTTPGPLLRTSSLMHRFSSSPPKDPPREPIPITFIDGAIIGPPPSYQPDSKEWTVPSLILSGPSLPAAVSPSLPKVLNVTQISDRIGSASTLKSCFSSLTKGLTALSILSFSTAQSASVLPQLTAHLEKYSPATLSLVSKSMPAMPPKASRWSDEMRQVGETFSELGELTEGRDIFEGFANLYQAVAKETELGRTRTRGKSVQDVATGLEVGLKSRSKPNEEDEENLGLTWRGSWS